LWFLVKQAQLSPSALQNISLLGMDSEGKNRLAGFSTKGQLELIDKL